MNYGTSALSLGIGLSTLVLVFQYMANVLEGVTL